MNEIFTVAGISVVSAGLVILLKQYKPEYAFGAALAAGIVLFFYIVHLLTDIFDFFDEMISSAGIKNAEFEILIRCMGIGVVAKIASDTCKDCGQGSIASNVDFAAKIFMLISAMPLFVKILGIIDSIINL